MPKIVMYSTGSCPYCVRAANLLQKKGAAYTEFKVDHDSALRAEMEKRSGRRTVPQIFVDDFHVGGFDDMAELDRQGKLDELLGLK